MVTGLDVVAEQRAFDKRTEELVAALDAHRPKVPADLAKAAAQAREEALALERAADERIELAADALRAGGDAGCLVGPRKIAVGVGAGNVYDDNGRVVYRPTPPLNEPLPDEALRLAEYVRDTYVPAELAAATAVVADHGDTRRALKGAALEHVARCRDRLQAGDGGPAARLRRALDEWAGAWERADGAIARADQRIARADAELARIAGERLRGMVPSLVGATPADLAVLDAVRPPAMTAT